MPRRFGVVLACCAVIALASSAIALAADGTDPAPATEPAAGPQGSAVPAPAVVAPTAPAAQPPAAAPRQATPTTAPEASEPATADAPAAPSAEPVDRPASRTAPRPARRTKKRRTARAAADGSVRIVDFKFSPRTISVNVGDRVTWTNSDSAPHTATDSGNFDTGRLGRGESGSATFDEAGTFNYICTFHPQMEGTVRVAGASGSGGGSSGSGDGGSAAGDDSSGSSSGGSGGDGSADDGADGGSLPATGADLWLFALVGAAMAAAGVVLRRRLAAGA